jgi:hypothetical protein
MAREESEQKKNFKNSKYFISEIGQGFSPLCPSIGPVGLIARPTTPPRLLFETLIHQKVDLNSPNKV